MSSEGQAAGLRRWVARLGRVFRLGSRRTIAETSERMAAYRLLGLEPGADPRVVRQTFRRLAAVHHPDRHLGVAGSERAALMRRFSQITAAYHAIDA